MTTEDAYKYISRVESAIRYNTPIKALACILHIAWQIRDGRDEYPLIIKYFIQEDQEAEMKKQTIAGRKIIEEMAKEKAEHKEGKE